MVKELFDDLKRRMEGAVDALKREFAGLRTGRASANLLNGVVVNAYGNKTPLLQVGTVSVPEPRMITVQVWDKSLVTAVEKSIREAGLGLNPAADGQFVRVPIPELSQERRLELIKVAHKYAEQTKVAVRNVRRDGIEGLKKIEKDGGLSKDEHRQRSEQVQKLTDDYVKKVDDLLQLKEKEIQQI
ncbi:MAG: ribosome recycling factor [Alphaproteobacteria bacterium]|nr:ribosome recycling factor [Alphaproteobacteria bacterium]